MFIWKFMEMFYDGNGLILCVTDFDMRNQGWIIVWYESGRAILIIHSCGLTSHTISKEKRTFSSFNNNVFHVKSLCMWTGLNFLYTCATHTDCKHKKIYIVIIIII